MKCGYCGKEMVKGYIPTTNSILYFYPEETKREVFKGVPSTTVKLSDFPILRQKKAKAYYCHDCNVVVAIPLDKVNQ